MGVYLNEPLYGLEVRAQIRSAVPEGRVGDNMAGGSEAP